MSDAASINPTAKIFCDSIPTPALVLPSYHGHLLYSPPDLTMQLPPCVVEEQQKFVEGKESENKAVVETSCNKPYQLVLLDIVDILGKDFGKTSLKELSTINPMLLPIMSFRGLNGCAVNADQKSISVQTKMGRKVISLENYIERISIEKPIAAVSLADEVNIASTGHNRLRKSVERTLSWFKTMSNHSDLQNQSSLFGTVVVDHNHKDQLKKMIDVYNQSNVKGIVVGGIHAGETALARHELIADVRKIVSPNTFVMTHGCENLEEILTHLALGVDLIHTGYASKLTIGGSALLYKKHFRSVVGLETTKRDRQAEDGPEEMHAAKRLKADDEDKIANALCTMAGGDEEDGLQIKVDTTPMDEYSINLWDAVYRKDRQPLLEGCRCVACLYHTRAYIHHLLKSKELLAEILLYHHNQYQLQELFCVAREQIRHSTFSQWKAELLGER